MPAFLRSGLLIANCNLPRKLRRCPESRCPRTCSLTAQTFRAGSRRTGIAWRVRIVLRTIFRPQGRSHGPSVSPVAESAAFRRSVTGAATCLRSGSTPTVGDDEADPVCRRCGEAGTRMRLLRSVRHVSPDRTCLSESPGRVLAGRPAVGKEWRGRTRTRV